MSRIHFVGIGGSGMSALAGILHERGYRISGSDAQSSPMTEKLRSRGISIMIGEAGHIPDGTEKVVHSLAVDKNHRELREARLRGIPVATYPEAVGKLTREYRTIAVCGTHGKTTVTSLIAKTLTENLFDPTVIVGAQLKELGGRNFRVGRSKLLVLEACEYRRAFLSYLPNIMVLHTLDPDHLDYYRDFEDYLDAFCEFVERLPRDGYFFGNLDDDDVHRVLQRLQIKKFPSHNIFTYSTKYPSSDFYLSKNTVFHKNIRGGELHLQIPGAHNRTNALAAYSVCATLGMASRDILRILNKYAGASRRFEIKGRIGKTTLIDDYGHHPAEIEATLQAAHEKFPKEKICVVFQPHQYSRTKKLLKEFGTAFGEADFVIIPDIYEVRDTEEDKEGISPEKLVAEIQKHKGRNAVMYGKGEAATVEYLKKNHAKFGVIITMGAGDVWKIADALQSSSSSSSKSS